MVKSKIWRVFGTRTLTLVSGLLACVALPRCGSVRASDDDRTNRTAVERCEPDIFNEEWGIDCSEACNHVMACKPIYGDSDIASLTCNDCLGSCVAAVALGGNDLIEGTEEDRRSWECAELVTGCSALDHNCDLF